MTRRHGVTTDTPDRLVLDAGMVYINYGELTQVLIGATRGGSEWNLNAAYRDPPVDGARGKVKAMRRLESVNPMLTVNLLEHTATNMQYLIPGCDTPTTAFRIFVDDEAVGTGNGSDLEFALDNAPAASAYVNMYIADSLWPTDSWSLSNSSITFDPAPDSGDAIVADYAYSGAVASFTTLRGAALAAADYYTNAALVVEVSGKTDPLVIVLNNVLADGSFSMSFADLDEATPSVIFEAFFAAADLETNPYEIRFPEA